MSRICFIENRGKTVFWEAVAGELGKRGHAIGWIVQNHAFKPRASRSKSDAVVVIPYPRKAELRAPKAELNAALAADRGRSHFGNGDRHYTYYEARIEAALDALMPDVVIGESTLFHEQLVIRACKRRGLRYLHPSMTRYPADRLMILQDDTQNPLGGSGEVWSLDKIDQHVRSISTGQTIPTYMRKPDRLQKVRKAVSSARTWTARLGGERYNTPSLAHKLLLNRKVSARLKAWNELARPVPSGQRALLYPLQMQPEANLDIWGYPYADQVATLEAIMRAAPKDVVVAVKLNPKAKYEVSEELIKLARRQRRLVLLPMTMNMAEAQSQTIGTMTVTGTVGLEAVFGKGRCISLRHPIIAAKLPAFHGRTIEDAVRLLLEESQSGVGDEGTGRWLLEHFVRVSYPGIVNEPLFDSRAMKLENIACVADAIEATITTYTY
ncbi:MULTISPECIES: hypothetical protein [Sphingobium]|uniref:Capsule polysaccharide biosynthesis protein n=1 Tax=Sphingobium chungbukense TaxID=56193 RepID=A0A0M3ANP5_9SPHN|nr:MULTISPECIES: hypothetical protein [Sphingobium]AMK26078.1 Capsule polysaccharide biosynthesis protein [Sphingobium sp. TKS]KKW90556.1 hypothetical protein YP76_18350 [Sphingobium chungbukense]